MSKNSCVAAEEHGTCVLRMARVNCNTIRGTAPYMSKISCIAAGKHDLSCGFANYMGMN